MAHSARMYVHYTIADENDYIQDTYLNRNI
jgi:hypothetical protein